MYVRNNSRPSPQSSEREGMWYSTEKAVYYLQGSFPHTFASPSLHTVARSLAMYVEATVVCMHACMHLSWDKVKVIVVVIPLSAVPCVGFPFCRLRAITHRLQDKHFHCLKTSSTGFVLLLQEYSSYYTSRTQWKGARSRIVCTYSAIGFVVIATTLQSQKGKIPRWSSALYTRYTHTYIHTYIQ